MIQQGLLASLGCGGGERLLNLKDLLTVLQPSSKRLFEDGPIEGPLFLCQNRTKFRHFLPKSGRMRHKINVFRYRFYENAPVPRASCAILTGAEHRYIRQAESIARAPRTLPAGGHRIHRRVARHTCPGNAGILPALRFWVRTSRLRAGRMPALPGRMRTAPVAFDY